MRKRNKSIQFGQVEVQLSLLTDNIMVCVGNPIKYIKKLLEPIHEVTKLAK